MNLDKFAAVLTGIVTVAAITAVVASPNAAAVIRSGGNAFAESIRAALGN